MIPINIFLCYAEYNIEPFQGALFANNNGLEKAIEDFEAALKINSAHQNAKKYLCETLIAVGRNFEDDKKVRISFVLSFQASVDLSLSFCIYIFFFPTLSSFAK